MLRLMKTAMLENGILPPKATLIANHIGVPPYNLAKKDDYGLLTELGMTVAYDGLEMEL